MSKRLEFIKDETQFEPLDYAANAHVLSLSQCLERHLLISPRHEEKACCN